MKRSFVFWALVSSVVTTLLAPQVLSASTNLLLIVEGPFVVCENIDTTPSTTLTIAIPQLDDSHFVPGFSGNFGNVPLANPNNPDQYRDPMEDLESVLTINGYSSTVPWKLAAGPNTKMYHEKGDCSNLSPGLASSRLTVPIPNEMVAYRSVEYADRAYVIDSDSLNYRGPCPQPCFYGTSLVLHYLSVNLAGVHIKTTCSGPGPCTPQDQDGRDHDDWIVDPTPTNAATNTIGVDVDGELEIKLSAEPRIVSDSPDDLHQHSQEAFAAASKLSGVYRQWTYVYPPKPAKSVQVSVVQNKECQISSLVLCSNCQ